MLFINFIDECLGCICSVITITASFLYIIVIIITSIVNQPTMNKAEFQSEQNKSLKAGDCIIGFHNKVVPFAGKVISQYHSLFIKLTHRDMERIIDKIKNLPEDATYFSLEFFPPKTQQVKPRKSLHFGSILMTIRALRTYRPDWVACHIPYGHCSLM